MNVAHARIGSGTAIFDRGRAVRPESPVITSVFAFPKYHGATRVTSHRSEWVDELRPRLNDLTKLPVGWDGYRGQPVSFDCASFGADLLEKLCQFSVPAPSLVPGSGGTMQIEWHVGGFDIELDVKDVYNVIAYRRNCITGDEEEHELATDFSLVFSWLGELSKQARLAARPRQIA